MKSKGSVFSQRVYGLVTRIPAGKVTTYGSIARALHRPQAAHAVGAVMRANPTPIVVPCHRVVMSDGRLGGYGGPKGSERKVALLKGEGVRVINGKIDLSRHLFKDF